MSDWEPRPDITAGEERILKLCKKQKLWGFLHRYQHLILDEEIRRELRQMYAKEGPGRPPVAPEVLAVAMLLQVGFDVPDHEVPTLTAVDGRWKVVLGCMDATSPLFSQGTVFNFRERARRNGLMRRLLEKTVKIARETKGFSDRRMRALIDSSPLVGAGRVEDTFNLLGRALSQLVEASASVAGRDATELASELEVTVFASSSVKAMLDVDWRVPTARADALQELLGQFDRLRVWLQHTFDESSLDASPIRDSLAVVQRIIDQDTETDPPDADAEPVPGKSGTESTSEDGAKPGGARRIRDGVAEDRLISLSDPDMRNGRKSKTKVFAGYKRHVAADADVPGLIAAVHLLPANHHEKEGAKPLLDQLASEYEIAELHIDRGYLTSEAVLELKDRGVDVISKPPTPRIGPRFGKQDFDADFNAQTLTCPAGVTVPVPPSRVAWFPGKKCQVCDLRERCITERNKKGRQVKLHPREQWYRHMAAELATREGRERRRARVPVEHRLARVRQVQGNRARFRGLEKNQSHLEVVGAVANIYVIGKLLDQKRAA